MNNKRIVVTGMGVVSPIGNDLESFWKAAKSGKSGIKQLNRFKVPQHMSQVAGLISDYHPESCSIQNDYTGEDRALLFAVDAVNQALQQANLDMKNMNDATNCSLVISSAVATITSMERHFNHATQLGKNHISKSTIFPNNPYFKFNYMSDYLSERFCINGRSLLLPTGCAGSLDAIGYAISLINNGLSDVVITGASEAPITPLVVTAFSQIGATSTRFNAMPEQASRPFDKNRDGFVLAEGCGMLILESLEHAEKRGAKIFAEITGFASVNNCYHMTNIPENGLSIARACQDALNSAGLEPDAIDHINSHGSSTPQNDIAETNAYKHIFGEHYRNIPVTSNKSFLGHALAASNSLETIIAIHSLINSIVPPTINLQNQDEQCDLNVVANHAKHLPIQRILKNSSGFSGIHTSLIIESYQE